jgi:hypothetical protein
MMRYLGGLRVADRVSEAAQVDGMDQPANIHARRDGQVSDGKNVDPLKHASTSINVNQGTGSTKFSV